MPRSLQHPFEAQKQARAGCVTSQEGIPFLTSGEINRRCGMESSNGRRLFVTFCGCIHQWHRIIWFSCRFSNDYCSAHGAFFLSPLVVCERNRSATKIPYVYPYCTKFFSLSPRVLRTKHVNVPFGVKALLPHTTKWAF